MTCRAFEQGVEPEGGDLGPGARVQRQHDREREPPPARPGSIGQRRRGRRRSRAGGTWRARTRRASSPWRARIAARSRGAGQDHLHGVDDGVAGDDAPVAPDALGGEVGPVGLGGREAEVGEVVDDDPVVLLGHRPVVAAQARLDVDERDVARRWRRGRRRRWCWCRRARRPPRVVTSQNARLELRRGVADLRAPRRARRRRAARRAAPMPSSARNCPESCSS